MAYGKSGGYGKRPMWQWILIYVVVGGLIYGAIYYFVYGKKGGYESSNTSYQTGQQESGYRY